MKLKYSYYRLKWFLAQYIDFPKPIHIDIELNNTCNQKCLSCWHSGELPFDKHHMSIGSIRFYLISARKAGCMSVKFNLRGEPLLSEYLVDAISLAKKLGYIDIMINTNGILLSGEMCEKLSNAGLTTCIISVDSLHRDIYCKIHNVNKAQYKKLYENLKHLAYNKNYFDRIVLNFHVNQYNQNENFERYKKEIGWAKVVIRDTMKRLGKDISIKKNKKERKKRCPHMQRRLTVTANGKIYPCCVCYNEPEDINIGDYEIHINKIWEGKLRKKIMYDYRNGIYTNSCINCTSGDIWK